MLKENCKHIVFTRFDTHSASQFDKDWLKYRLEIFKKYTLQSLLHQEVQNFAIWIRYCTDFKEEVKEFNKYLKSLSIPCFFTYFKDGVDYETDELYEYVKDSEFVIETRIDSDDMYSKDAMSEIQNEEITANQIYIFQDGYLYRESTDKLYRYLGSCAPFYTCVHPTAIFIDQPKRMKHYPFLPDASKSTCKKMMSDNKYIVVVHDKNDSRYTDAVTKKNSTPSGSFSKVTEADEVIKNKQIILNNFKIWN